jgi:hypothetical protein
MTDLVQEFFKRDLTEAEHEALNGLLAGSPEAVERYEGLLKENYLATGLPQPVLPKGLQHLPHAGGGLAHGPLALTLAGLATVGVLAWKFWPQPLTPMVSKSPVEAPKPVMKQVLKKPVAVEPFAAGPGQEGQELSVIVNAPQRSLVTVRILDAQGKEVRALYTGFVEPGKWAFRWDGLLRGGAPAGAGDYRIDVQSGAAHMTKEVKISLNPASP